MPNIAGMFFPETEKPFLGPQFLTKAFKGSNYSIMHE